MSNKIRLPVYLFGCPIAGVYLLETYNGFFAMFINGSWIGSIKNQSAALDFYIDYIAGSYQ